MGSWPPTPNCDWFAPSSPTSAIRYALGPVLTLAVCTMLCGARSLYAIARWGRDQDPRLWSAIGIAPRTGRAASVASPRHR